MKNTTKILMAFAAALSIAIGLQPDVRAEDVAEIKITADKITFFYDIKEFKDTIINMGRSEYSTKGYMDSADIDGLAQIVHYVESVFMRFDTNADGKILTDEAAAMVPIYISTMRELSEYTERATLQLG